MDPELNKKIAEMDAKIEAIYASVEKTRRYFLIMTWITVIGILLPLIGLAFAIPSFMSNYVGALGGI